MLVVQDSFHERIKDEVEDILQKIEQKTKR